MEKERRSFCAFAIVKRFALKKEMRYFSNTEENVFTINPINSSIFYTARVKQ